jgi:hypothetical protein
MTGYAPHRRQRDPIYARIVTTLFLAACLGLAILIVFLRVFRPELRALEGAL